MNVLIAGGSGFIGRHLLKRLQKNKQYQVSLLGRKKHSALNVSQWLWSDSSLSSYIAKQDLIINLCGAAIMDKRWTAAYKQDLLKSRVKTTDELVQLIQQSHVEKLQCFLQTSAVGYYGACQDDRSFDENSAAGSDFLAELCANWEKASEKLPGSVRRLVLRIGIVLGNNGGALPKISLPFRYGFGGFIGSGHQWLSWIHINDLVNMMLYLIEHDFAEGIINAVAPEPVDNKTFSQCLAQNLRRPCRLRVPSTFLRICLGERAVTLTHGQRVISKKAKSLGYNFLFPRLEDALDDLHTAKN